MGLVLSGYGRYCLPATSRYSRSLARSGLARDDFYAEIESEAGSAYRSHLF